MGFKEYGREILKMVPEKTSTSFFLPAIFFIKQHSWGCVGVTWPVGVHMTSGGQCRKAQMGNFKTLNLWYCGSGQSRQAQIALLSCDEFQLKYIIYYLHNGFACRHTRHNSFVLLQRARASHTKFSSASWCRYAELGHAKCNCIFDHQLSCTNESNPQESPLHIYWCDLG